MLLQIDYCKLDINTVKAYDYPYHQTALYPYIISTSIMCILCYRSYQRRRWGLVRLGGPLNIGYTHAYAHLYTHTYICIHAHTHISIKTYTLRQHSLLSINDYDFVLFIYNLDHLIHRLCYMEGILECLCTPIIPCVSFNYVIFLWNDIGYSQFVSFLWSNNVLYIVRPWHVIVKSSQCKIHSSCHFIVKSVYSQIISFHDQSCHVIVKSRLVQSNHVIIMMFCLLSFYIVNLCHLIIHVCHFSMKPRILHSESYVLSSSNCVST